MYPNLMKENRRMSTCDRLDLQTLGSQPVIMPQNLPDHWCNVNLSEEACKKDKWIDRLVQIFDSIICNGFGV